MRNFQACNLDWDQKRGQGYLEAVMEKCECDGFVISEFDHETVLLNKAIELCNRKYLWFLTTDLDIMYPDTPYLMVEWMEAHPEVGAMIPNRQGERFVGGRMPYKKYLEDNTAMMYRMSVGARFDEEFFLTGWSDLDFGESIEAAGFEVWVDPRTCVNKHPTLYGSWPTFRSAYNARNRLLLEAKWYWCGIENWKGVDVWNAANPDRRIPTIYELAFWGEQTLIKFAESVNHEHPQILIKDGQDSGNTDWRFDAIL